VIVLGALALSAMSDPDLKAVALDTVDMSRTMLFCNNEEKGDGIFTVDLRHDSGKDYFRVTRSSNDTGSKLVFDSVFKAAAMDNNEQRMLARFTADDPSQPAHAEITMMVGENVPTTGNLRLTVKGATFVEKCHRIPAPPEPTQ
jgi:hypothetical protein